MSSIIISMLLALNIFQMPGFSGLGLTEKELFEKLSGPDATRFLESNPQFKETFDLMQSKPSTMFDQTDGVRAKPSTMFDQTDGVRANPSTMFDQTDGVRAKPSTMFDQTDGVRAKPSTVFDQTDGI
ncbi:MAG: hypothetical protein A3G23_14850 [Bacteroidetes bacterium RIFCSPLOWO2_12_FULL_37_12]|nr:MAG: hypothetical protein A3G23_14850 [Bacteroidetes bacterium RIFCSPLOWO2_12_FULL_37_12]